MTAAEPEDTGRGGGGAKGGGQGEHEPLPHVPDTGPGKRVTGVGACTEGRAASRQHPRWEPYFDMRAPVRPDAIRYRRARSRAACSASSTTSAVR
jgi:hypothetical protein